MTCKKGFKAITTLCLCLISTVSIAQNVVTIMTVGNSVSEGATGSSDGVGFRNDLHDKLTANDINFDFVGSTGTAPYEGYFLDGSIIEDFYSGGFGNGSFDIASAMNTFKPSMILVHVGTNNVRNDLNEVAPYSNNNGATFNNTASGKTAEFIQYLMKWKNGANGSFLKQILLSQIIPKQTATKVGDFNNALAAFVSDVNNGNIPSIPPGNVTIVDQNTTFNENTMHFADGIHPNDTGYENIAEVYKNYQYYCLYYREA